MQCYWDPYLVSTGTLFGALLGTILALLGKFFFCTAGGCETRRSDGLSGKG